MYKLPDGQIDILSLIKPLEGLINPANRWVRLADSIPWERLEAELAPKLYSQRGAPAKPLRLLLGAMLIGDRLGLSDGETARQLQENPYLQYFVGFHEFRHERLFSPQTLTLFRRRLTPQLRRQLRRILREKATKQEA